MDKAEQLKTWSSYWESDFHCAWMSDKPNYFLWKYLDLIRFDGEGIFFVPCCGNTPNLKMLYEEGFQVVGVELYEPAVQNFFREKNLEFLRNPMVKRNSDGGEFVEYATPDRRLRILVGDVTAITPDLVGGPVKAVWDKGALGSIHKSLRKDYVRAVTSLLAPEARYLFDCFHYKDWYQELPPRNFPRELIAELLEPNFHVKFLEAVPRKLKHLQVDALRNAYLMCLKK